MSIDLYPALDRGETDVAVALERIPVVGRVRPIGAASLLYENDPELWPEFQGRDLISFMPGIAHRNLCQDGATIGDVFGDQLSELPPDDERTLVTLTLGGNDLLSAWSNAPGKKLMASIVRDIQAAYDVVVDEVLRRLPNAKLVLTTVYDPSDDTGRIPGVLDDGKLPLEFLAAFNAHVRELAEAHPDTRLADAHAHFMGHGVSVAENERWYWRRSLIEPNAAGANELRRLWVEIVEGEEV